MELFFVRHTSVDINPGTCYGQSDVPLKSSFPEEAASVAERLRILAGERGFDAVYTSPLSRCTRLAEYCGYTKALRDSRLMEIHFGQWEMQHWDEIDTPLLQRWFENWQYTATPGGESMQDQKQRVGTFIEEIRTQNIQRGLIFAHVGTTLCARMWIEKTPAREIFTNRPSYGEIIRFEIG